MATVAVQEFLGQVATDQTLQAEFAQALQSQNDREAVTELANQKGYEFSADELVAEIQQRHKDFEKRQEVGELSDEELEAIDGGATPLAVLTIGMGLMALASLGSGVFLTLEIK